MIFRIILSPFFYPILSHSTYLKVLYTILFPSPLSSSRPNDLNPLSISALWKCFLLPHPPPLDLFAALYFLFPLSHTHPYTHSLFSPFHSITTSSNQIMIHSPHPLRQGIKPRWSHTTTRVNDTLYIIGGMTDSSITPDVITHVGARKGGKGTGVVVEEEEEGTYASQVLTLPLSRAFHFADPPIRHLRVEVSEATPLISGHVTLPHGTSDLITYGGSYASMDTGSDIPPPDVYQLHLEGQPSPGHGGRAWWEAIQSPQAPNLPHSPRRFEHAAAVTPDGTSWVYGGVVDRTCDRSMRPHEVLYLNDLHRHSIGPTQSSIAFHHQQGAPYIPTPRFQHTLSALPDGSLVLLGGTNGTHLSSMAEITIYHPNRNEWTQKVAKGSIPISRRDHVAVGKFLEQRSQ